MPPTIYTIGHSTRSIAEFIALLKRHDIALLCDVRSIPKSRHVPQFGQDQLPQSLAEAGIKYQWMSNLGGRRHTTKDSPNMGWRNASFRGYADYMQTPEFAATLRELEQLATNHRVAIMCAEAVPWRCHRSLIADALTIRGWHALEIIDEHEPKLHKLNPMAKVAGNHITYPPVQSELL